MRIVHCGIFNDFQFGKEYYSTDRKISEGLILNGHYVYNFSYRDISRLNIFMNKKFGIKKMNNSLVKTIENIKPELLLLGHSELITNETILCLKEKSPKLKIGMWWVDWIYNLKNINNFIERLELIDKFFITSSPLELQKLNITNTLLEKCYYMPNICSESIDTNKAFENSEDDYEYDLLYIGRRDKGEREKLIDFLENNFKNIRVGIFGTDKESLVFGTEYLNLISKSKMAINFNRDNSLGKYSSDRIIHLAANGTTVLSAKIPDFEEVFKEEEVLYFEDFNQLKVLVDKYLTNRIKRIEFAKKSYLKSHKYYNNQMVTSFLIDTIFERNDKIYNNWMNNEKNHI
jgi:hypothetical protein